MYLKNAIAMLVMCAGVFTVHAQAPGWTFTPGNYQYTMTVVAFLNVDGKTLTGEHDRVAAFVDNEVRGVASPIYVASADRYLAYLTIFANREKETIHFRVYDGTSNKVVEVEATLTFTIDGQTGNVFQAFSLARPVLSREAEVHNFYFTDVDSVSTNITPGKVDITLEYDQDLKSLQPGFVISDGARMYLDRSLQQPGDTTFDFSTPVTYSVLSEDESVLNTYQVTVTNRKTAEAGFVCTNVVTANNDGSNDHWIVQDVFRYKDHEFRIFDADGRVLFESTGYNNDWDGTYKGTRVQRGKYYFMIKDPVEGAVINGSILVLY